MDILQFLNQSYTAFHATENACAMLREGGFAQLEMGQDWSLQQGGKYYVTANDSSFVAFRIGPNKIFNICESHTDSPSFKIKGDSILTSGGVHRLNSEKYGGGILYSFFDRPLKIAGRIVCQTESGVQSQVVTSNYNVVIPSLAVHHNPGVNDCFSVNPQTDTLPLFSQTQTDLYATFTDKKVVDADLFAVPATPAFFAGAQNEFLCSPRLDNLTSVYCSVQALLQCTPQDIAIVACLDNEEIGSGTRHGSPDFIKDVLKQIQHALGFSLPEKAFARRNGFILSVDNGHAIHPAHEEKSDPQKHVHMNGGIVIKHHTNYATTGLTSGIFKKLLQDVDVPFQDYYNRSDVRCGSTLGLKTSARLGIKACDIGLAQLAMHSACETTGAHDLELMQKALCAFLSAKFTTNGSSVEVKQA